MATESLIIEVDEKGTRVVKRNIDDIGKTSAKSGDAVNLLKTALKGLGAGLAIRQIHSYGQAWVRTNNSLRSALTDTQSMSKAQEDVIGIALRARGPLEQVSNLYAGISAASTELGASQQQIAEFTELAAKSIAVQGSSAGEAAGALLQLRQAIGGAVIQAQEFNSLIDGARPLLEAVANGSDRFGGSIAKLREDVRSGTVTSKEFFDAALKGADIIEKRFGKTVVTTAQAMQNLNTVATKTVGTFLEASGITSGISNSILFLADNFDTLARSVLAVSSVIIGVFIKKALLGAVAGVKALTAAILANPIGALAVALTTAVSALVAFSDQISLSGDGAATLFDLFAVTFTEIGAGFSYMKDLAVDAFDTIMSFGTEAFDTLESASGGAITAIIAGVTSIATFAATGVNQFVGLFVGAFNVIKTLWEGIDTIIAHPFQTALVLIVKVLNTIKDLFVGTVNFMVRQVNKLTSAFEILQIPELTIPDIELPTGIDQKVTELGENVAQAFKDGVNSQPVTTLINATLDAADKKLEDLSNKAEARAQKRIALSEAERKRQQELLSLQKLQTGTGDQEAKKLTELQKINGELEKERFLLGLSNREREVQERLMKAIAAIAKEDQTITAAQKEQLETDIRINQQLALRADVLNTIQEPQIRLNELTAIYGDLMKQNLITQDQAAQAVLASNSDILAGTNQVQEAIIASHEGTMLRLQNLRDADLISQETYNQARVASEQKVGLARIANERKTLDILAGLVTNGTDEIAAIGQAAAITQATISGFVAAQKALELGPILGPIAAAGIAVQTAANINAIASARQLGGDLNRGELARVGEGGLGRNEIFKTSRGEQFFIPSERGRVEPISQRGGQSQQPVVVNPEINNQPPAITLKSVNIIDNSMLADALNTPEGEQLIVNAISRNETEFKQRLGLES